MEEPLIAPKATPEDTAVTSSASDTNLDSMQCDMLNASDDEKLEKLEQLKHALLGHLSYSKHLIHKHLIQYNSHIILLN